MTVPHTSEQLLTELYQAICTIETPQEAERFLQDLCSKGELADLSQRLEVARELAQGLAYSDVILNTGASSTTVSRVNKCLRGDVGGYREVLAKLGETLKQ